MEKLNTFISALAIIIAGIALWRTWNLNKMQAELTRIQLELANNRLIAQCKASIIVSLKKTPTGERFIVSNVGSASAKNVELKFILPKGQESPVCSDFKETFPAKIIHPNEPLSVLAALTKDSGTNFEYVAKWGNPDNTKGVKEGIVSLNC